MLVRERERKKERKSENRERKKRWLTTLVKITDTCVMLSTLNYQME